MHDEPLTAPQQPEGRRVRGHAVDRNVGAVAANTSTTGTLAYFGYAAVSLLLAIPAVAPPDRQILPRLVMANPVVARVGLVSYGVFLYHPSVIYRLGLWQLEGKIPVLGFPGLVAASLAASLAIAAVSYYAVERPLLRFKERREQNGGRTNPTGTEPSALPAPHGL